MDFLRSTAILTSFNSLRGDLSLIGNAIEELFRYDLSVQVTGRTTLDDVDKSAVSRSKRVNRLSVSSARPIATQRSIRTPSTDIMRRDVRPIRSAVAFTTASAPNLPALRLRSRLQPYCADCQTCDSITSSIPIGGRPLSCAA